MIIIFIFDSKSDLDNFVGFFFSGIGFCLADRLLTIEPTIVLCLACRNPSRADAARKTLLANHPEARIELIRLDTSDIKGIYDTAKSIKRK